MASSIQFHTTTMADKTLRQGGQKGFRFLNLPPDYADKVSLQEVEGRDSRASAARRRRAERSRKSLFRSPLKLLFVTTKIDRPDKDRDSRNENHGNGDRTGDRPDLLAKQIGAEPESRRPTDPAASIEEQESQPRHLIDSGEKRRQRPQECDEPAEEHDLSAMTEKEVTAQFESCLGETRIVPVAEKQG